MVFEQTYTIVPGPPALSFDAYETQAMAEYHALLETAAEEAPIQRFLERNPCFVPRASTPGSHGALFSALFSKAPLPGVRIKIPDFMWITSNSAEWYPTLVEIESPTKELFRNDGVPTSQFTQARNQLSQWRAWFSEPSNTQKFISDYGIPDEFVRFKTMKPTFILVYGRRREFQGDPVLSKQRGALMPAPDEELVSFDRLAPQRFVRDVVTARASGSGRCAVLAVMPTMRLGPVVADRFLNFDGLAEAIGSDQRISEERRLFLRGCLAYWRDWLAGPPGIVNTGDWE